MFLKFLVIVANASVSVALISHTKCGSVFYTKFGTFSYQNHNTQNNKKCEWRISADPDEIITITFRHLDLEKSPNCSLASVELRDGFWSTSPYLYKFCGQGQLIPVSSTGNKMLVSYSNPNENGGFVAEYEAICGGYIIVDEKAQFATPNYPELYPSNKKCIWKITVHDDKKAALMIESFDIEEEDDCLYDYVEIRDGFTSESNLIGVYCNRSMPFEVISSTNTLLVKFVSDATMQKSGFSATIVNEHDECVTTTHKCAQICINTVGSYRCNCRSGFQLHPNGKDCEAAYDGTITTLSGTIKSPFWPEMYPLNNSYTWDIIVPPQYLIKVVFNHIDLEYSQTCDKDSLAIFNNVSNILELEHSYCGDFKNDLPDPLISSSNIMKIVFNSNENVQKSGFILDFEAVLDGCNINNGNCQHGCSNSSEPIRCVCSENFTLEKNHRDCSNNFTYYEIATVSGSIHSFNYPNNYPVGVTFEWQFTTTPGHRLNISIVDLETESCFDRLEFYDGTSITDPSLARVCTGTFVSSRPIYSSSNKLYMVFVSVLSQPRRGFLLTYTSVCGGVLQADIANTKYLYSHANFGYSDYSSNSYCEWIVTADSGYCLELLFLDFHLEETKNCLKDYVEILDGNSSCALSFGKFCGSERPPQIASSGNSLLLRFRTDDAITGRGFSLTYQLINTVATY